MSTHVNTCQKDEDQLCKGRWKTELKTELKQSFCSSVAGRPGMKKSAENSSQLAATVFSVTVCGRSTGHLAGRPGMKDSAKNLLPVSCSFLL
ncbi:hypothetical protein, partial [Streptomyces clavifer]|uniref:hypothetical protein n=1 Tax=Streptomyces clavifer TaxID=68188 RepID=UPI00238129DC